MTTLTQEEANKRLALLVENMQKAFNEAESFADQHGLEFHFSPAYGMGGWYDGKEGQWNASSESC